MDSDAKLETYSSTEGTVELCPLLLLQDQEDKFLSYSDQISNE